MIMWAKDNIGTEGRPLCKKGVAAAKAKSAAEADKPMDMTPKDRQNITAEKQSSAAEKSVDDSDKDNKNHRKQPSTTATQAVQD